MWMIIGLLGLNYSFYDRSIYCSCSVHSWWTEALHSISKTSDERSFGLSCTVSILVPFVTEGNMYNEAGLGLSLTESSGEPKWVAQVGPSNFCGRLLGSHQKLQRLTTAGSENSSIAVTEYCNNSLSKFKINSTQKLVLDFLWHFWKIHFKESPI